MRGEKVDIEEIRLEIVRDLIAKSDFGFIATKKILEDADKITGFVVYGKKECTDTPISVHPNAKLVEAHTPLDLSELSSYAVIFVQNADGGNTDGFILRNGKMYWDKPTYRRIVDVEKKLSTTTAHNI